MRRFVRSWSWLVLGIPLCLGCGGGEAPTTDDVAEAPAGDESSASIKRVDSSKLPPLGNALPTLDKGRVANLAPPKGWEPLTRDNNHLARFALNKTNPNDLPRILITVDDSTDFTDDVTADNVAEFATVLASNAAKKYVEPPKPIILGDNTFARYVTQAKKANRLVERQVLETVFDGRRYSFVLEVYAENLVKNRDLAYAVAAGVQFTAPGGNAAAPPMPEEKKAEETKTE
jgi:hypothetical protein